MRIILNNYGAKKDPAQGPGLLGEEALVLRWQSERSLSPVYKNQSG
jgi:hypothetical protein